MADATTAWTDAATGSTEDKLAQTDELPEERQFGKGFNRQKMHGASRLAFSYNQFNFDRVKQNVVPNL